MKFLKKIWVYVLLGSVSLVHTALAQPSGDAPDVGGTAEDPLGVTGIHQLQNPLAATTTDVLIATVGQFLIKISTALLVIFILWGALQLMTSGGSPERVEKGRKTIYWAILGFIVLLVAGGIGALIANILGRSDVPIEGAEAVDAPITNFSELEGVLMNISRWMFGILMALSIVFILYAAFLYIISQGNEERIKTAKTILIYAVVGLVVAVLAGGINMVIQDFIGNM